MRTSKEWMREDTWHFEVEVLRIYGRQELWSHGFGARPVSDGPYQPVDAADVRRRVAFGARQDNEFAVRHCCVLGRAGLSRWRLPHRVFPSLLEGESTPMSQSTGTSDFAPAWGVHHCPSLQASEGGSSYGSRGRPPDTTGRAVPLTGFPRGFLEEGSRPRMRQRTGLQQDQHPQGSWTNNACGHNSTLISHVRQP
ncbi:hypothetical protein THAOC_10019 [Thalassiosira oceanica]|uniref:DUF6743 domain-containing protein n=1 Tax=Thalassiosira oceanica TaxID=159749 RepID=K0SV06_THAOC|nr:hypothetical protein THAOC_10019 [Thalassiosira oceanica]|eukprot:EJK68769.1 hypothetical protein THAOC_10019 [Thalassiosira oceanica]